METLRKFFSESILIKVNGIRQITEPIHKKKLKESIDTEIRKYTDVIKPKVSQKANEIANKMGIDLTTKDWSSQNSFDKGRSTFHFEHYYPVKQITDDCLACHCIDDVCRVLKEKTMVVWILKSENSTLDGLGYKSNRPNPKEAYAKAGITILNF